LARVAVKKRDDVIEFVLRRAPVALDGFSNQAKARERRARELGLLD
jgi:hypothetical protein